MKLPFISREAHEREKSAAETEIWELRQTVKVLRERERARMVVCDTLAEEAAENRRAREALEEERAELRERVRLLNEDNRELRRRYDTARAELQRAGREITTLRLMRTALEARVAAKCEVEHAGM